MTRSDGRRIALVCVALWIVAGCGGGDADTSPPAASPVASPSPSVAPASPPEPAETTSAPTGPPSAPPSTSPAATDVAATTVQPAPPAPLPEPFADLDVPAGDAYCDWARHAAALFERWIELTRTPSENEAYVVSLRPAWEQMERTAPPELRDHFPIVTELYLYVWQTLEESGYDMDAQQAEFGDEIAGRRDQRFLASAQTIESYGIGVCDITPP